MESPDAPALARTLLVHRTTTTAVLRGDAVCAQLGPEAGAPRVPHEGVGRGPPSVREIFGGGGEAGGGQR